MRGTETEGSVRSFDGLTNGSDSSRSRSTGERSTETEGSVHNSDGQTTGTNSVRSRPTANDEPNTEQGSVSPRSRHAKMVYDIMGNNQEMSRAA